MNTEIGSNFRKNPKNFAYRSQRISQEDAVCRTQVASTTSFRARSPQSDANGTTKHTNYTKEETPSLDRELASLLQQNRQPFQISRRDFTLSFFRVFLVFRGSKSNLRQKLEKSTAVASCHRRRLMCPQFALASSIRRPSSD